MSLFGGLVAGAMQGGGEAGVKVGLAEQEALIQEARASRLADLQREIEGVRQTGENTRLETRETGEAARLDTREKGQNTRLQISETGATARQNAGFTHSENLATARQDFDREQNAMQRDLTREQIAASKAIAALNRGVSLEIAKLGGTVQQDKNGNVIMIGKDGATKQIMDPSNPDKPLVGFKDLTPAAKAYADVIKGQLVSLNTAEANGTGDEKTLQQRRAALNGELLNVLTGGIGEAGKGGSAIKDPFKSGAVKDQPKANPGAGIVGSVMQKDATPNVSNSGATKKAQQKQPSESTAAYEAAMRDSFLTKVAERVGAGTVDFATAVGKLGWDWDHFHNTGELKRKYATQGMTPIGDSLG